VLRTTSETTVVISWQRRARRVTDSAHLMDVGHPGGVGYHLIGSDDTGTNFGSVIFNMGGAEVRVMGHNDEAVLETIARSILSQSGS
jgi:hypothetical protein